MTSSPPKSSNSLRALSAGLTLAVSTALLAWCGIWLDQRLATAPLFVVIGVLWGFLGGTLHLIRVLAPELLPFRRRSSKNDDDSPEP